MQVTVTPKPVPAGTTYTITPSGGTPAYSFLPDAGNPPGVTYVVVGGVCEVTVPAGTPSKANIRFTVFDSAAPPASVVATNWVK